MPRQAAFTVLGFMACLLGAPRAAAAADSMTIVHPWMRYIIAARPAAGYFTLKNESNSMKVLTGASSPACGMIMLHRSMSKDGANAMVKVDSVNVAAHSSIEFSPGGYHLMCMSPAKDMKKHKSVPVTLSFQDGTSIKADFRVRGAVGD